MPPFPFVKFSERPESKTAPIGRGLSILSAFCSITTRIGSRVPTVAISAFSGTPNGVPHINHNRFLIRARAHAHASAIYFHFKDSFIFCEPLPCNDLTTFTVAPSVNIPNATNKNVFQPLFIPLFSPFLYTFRLRNDTSKLVRNTGSICILRPRTYPK